MVGLLYGLDYRRKRDIAHVFLVPSARRAGYSGFMENLLTTHAHISRHRHRLLVRLTCAGRVLWRSYPLEMPEDEAVMLAVKRQFPTVQPEPHRQNQKEGDIGGNDGSDKVGVSQDSLQSLRVVWWAKLL